MKHAILLLALILNPPSFAAECPSTEEVDGSASVHTPGKTIYAQFSNHPVNDEADFARALNGADPAEITKNLRAYIQDNARYINGKRWDRKALLKLLEEKKIRWIGIEASPKEVATGTSDRDLVENMRKSREELKFYALTEQEREDVLSVLYPDYIRLLLDNPQAMRGIQVVPLDDDAAKEKSFAILADRENIYERLQKLVPARARVIKDRTKQLIRDLKPMSPSEISAFLENDPPGEMRATAEVLFALSNEFVKLSHERDARAAAVALAQPGSGYVLMGAAHGPGILRRLRQACAADVPAAKQTDRDTGAKPGPAPSSR